MKLVVFSDIHGNRYSFQAFLERLENIECDKVLFCGDVFGYYYYADEIVKKMKERGFICLLGNHDKMLLDIIDGKYSKERIDSLYLKYGSVYKNVKKTISEEVVSFLRSLNSEFGICDNGLHIGFYHGTPDDPLNGRLYPDTEIVNAEIYQKYDYVFLGHTHHKMIRYIGNTVIINPGSLGQQRDGKGCSFIRFDTDKRECLFEIIKYDRSPLIRDIGYFDNGKESLAEVLFRNRSYN